MDELDAPLPPAEPTQQHGCTLKNDPAPLLLPPAICFNCQIFLEDSKKLRNE